MEIDCYNIANNHVMDTVSLIVDGVLCFTGKIKGQEDTKNGLTKVSRLSAVDNTDKLQRLLVAQVYENKTPKEMLNDLITRYAPWVDTSLVQDLGGQVESMFFNYDTLSAAIQKLADLSGAYWYLDPNNKLHFFENYDSVSSKTYDSTKNILKDTFNLATEAADLCNRVWVIGAKSAAANYINQYWTGDGNNAVFSLAYVPNYVDIWENGTPKTVEVEKGTDSEKDYTYDKKNKVLKRVGGNLPSGVLLRMRYKPTIQVIDYFEDPNSVAKYGLYEKAIRDKKITDKTAARKRGRSELKRNKSLVRVPSFSTRDWKINIGQLVSVKVESFSFLAACRIDSISVQFTPQDIVADISATEVFV